MIVLDTTVLVYAVGTEHAYRGPCQDLIAAVTEGAVHATTTAEVIQEFCHIRSRRRSPSDAVVLAQDFAELLSPLQAVDEQRLSSGLDLFATQPSLGSFDAVLAAVARETGATSLVSADRAFSGIPRLRHVLPDRAGVAGLLD